MENLNLETNETTSLGSIPIIPNRWLVTDNKELFDNDTYKICSFPEAIMYLGEDPIELQVDSETEGFDPYTDKILCLQIGDRAGENQFLFPWNKDIAVSLKQLLERTDIVFVFQNAQFDLKFLRHAGIIVTNVFDIFLAECVLTTGYRNEDERELGLDALVKSYTGNILDKSIRGVIFREGLSARVIKYACEDVQYMSTIKEKQLKKLEARDLLTVMQLENESVIAFAAMCYNGIKINTETWTEVAKEVDKLVEQQIDTLNNIVLRHKKLNKFKPKATQISMFGFEAKKTNINWSSNKQKLSILTTMGLDIDNVGDRILQKNKKNNLLVKELIEYNKASKLQSSFGMKFLEHINPVSSRVHSTIWQILTTGRISVSKPNLAQIPTKGDLGKTIRNSFIAEEGNSIVGGDYSGMELRLLAEFSQDPIWINAFNEGKDLHSVLCAMTFNIPIEDVKKPFPLKPDISYRDVQKTINFGLSYGMSQFKLADTMDISVKDAEKLIYRFFKAVPKVKETLDMFGDLAKKWGYIRTASPFRRIRLFPQWEEAKLTNNFIMLGEIERAAKNLPMQGTNGDILKLAISTMQKKIDKEQLAVKIVLSIYDEIRCECPDELAEWWKGEMQRIMIESAQVVIKSIPVVVDCNIAKYWSK